jgi:hypothetical protein
LYTLLSSLMHAICPDYLVPSYTKSTNVYCFRCYCVTSVYFSSATTETYCYYYYYCCCYYWSTATTTATTTTSIFSLFGYSYLFLSFSSQSFVFLLHASQEATFTKFQIWRGTLRAVLT